MMKISRDEMLNVIQPYGFIECGEMQIFLRSLCHKYPSEADLLWLLDKTKHCLNNYSNGSDYFHELERLKVRIKKELSRQSMILC